MVMQVSEPTWSTDPDVKTTTFTDEQEPFVSAMYAEIERLQNEVKRLTSTVLPAHPESQCQKCHGPNVTWYAPNALWNAVMGSPDGIICPVCFIRAAEEKGFNTKAWRVDQDTVLPGEIEEIRKRHQFGIETHFDDNVIQCVKDRATLLRFIEQRMDTKCDHEYWGSDYCSKCGKQHPNVAGDQQ